MPRYLTMIRIDENDAPADGPSPEMQQRMGELFEEITKAGVMLDTGGLKPTAEASRVTFSGGHVTVTDGPFTESKEVVGGYSICQAKDKAEALEWATRFLRTHDEHWTITAEVREIEEG